MAIYEVKRTDGETVSIIEYPHPLSVVELIKTIPAEMDDQEPPQEIIPESYVFGVKDSGGGVVFEFPSATNDITILEEQTNV